MKQILWAIQHKKEGYGRNGDFYKQNELVEVGLFRRLLAKSYNPKYERIIKLCEFDTDSPLKDK